MKDYYKVLEITDLNKEEQHYSGFKSVIEVKAYSAYMDIYTYLTIKVKNKQSNYEAIKEALHDRLECFN